MKIVQAMFSFRNSKACVSTINLPVHACAYDKSHLCKISILFPINLCLSRFVFCRCISSPSRMKVISRAIREGAVEMKITKLSRLIKGSVLKITESTELFSSLSLSRRISDSFRDRSFYTRERGREGEEEGVRV